MSESSARFVAVGAPREPAPFDPLGTRRVLETLTSRVHAHGRVIRPWTSAPVELALAPPKRVRRWAPAPAAIAASITVLAMLTTLSFVPWRGDASSSNPVQPNSGRSHIAEANPASTVGPTGASPRPEATATRLASLDPPTPKSSAARASSDRPAARRVPASKAAAPLLRVDAPVQLAQVDAAAEPPASVQSLDEPLRVAAVEVSQPEAAGSPLLVVSRQASLGGESSSRRGGPLGDIRSGNPLRMASAITASAR